VAYCLSFGDGSFEYNYVSNSLSFESLIERETNRRTQVFEHFGKS